MVPFLTFSLAIQLATITAAETAPTTRPTDDPAAARPKILFTEDFEGPDLSAWGEQHGTAQLSTDRPHAGQKCLAIPMHRGKDTGGHLIKWLSPGADTVHVRFYVRFSKNYQYNHHFVTLMGAPPNDRWRPFGKAGLKPDGTYFGTGLEPWFAWGKNPPPGELNFYSYFVDMEIDRKMNKYWGNCQGARKLGHFGARENRPF